MTKAIRIKGSIAVPAARIVPHVEEMLRDHKRALEPPEDTEIISAYLRGRWNGSSKITALLS